MNDGIVKERRRNLKVILVIAFRGDGQTLRVKGAFIGQEYLVFSLEQVCIKQAAENGLVLGKDFDTHPITQGYQAKLSLLLR